MEPSAVSGRLRSRPRRPARPPAWPGNYLTIDAARLRSAFAAGALGACAVGLLGVDGGLIWLVAGVWTVRAIAGATLNIAWGLACLGAGLRWGTLGLADLGVATKVFEPTVLAGSPTVRGGMAVALVAAIVGEAQVDGLRAGSVGEKAAAFFALAALVPLFCAPGPGSPELVVTFAWWVGAGAVLTAATLALPRFVGDLRPWVAPVAAFAGAVAAAFAR